MTISAFIIDDEAPSRRELRYLLGQLGGIAVVGEAATPSAGLQGIRSSSPQLLFLDINLPGLTGIELAQVLAELPARPLVVFTTAFEQYAVQAFELEALDYLLKPLTLARLAKAVEKAMRVLPADGEPAPDTRPEEEKEDARRVLVHKGERLIPIPPESIVFIRAAEGESVVHVRDGVFTSRSTLGALEANLERYAFVRVHRNALVNLKCVAEFIPWFNGSCKLIMNDRAGSEILVSRYHAREVKERLILCA